MAGVASPPPAVSQIGTQVLGPLADRLLRDNQALLASLIGAGVALVLMAAFFVYQKWRYDRRPTGREG